MTEPNRPPASNQPPARTKARKRSAGLASLTGDAQFRQVRRGRTVRTPYFTLRAVDYRPRHGQPWKPMTVVGIVVPKKTLKRAVDRNRARRRVREAMRTLDLPPCRAILMPSPEVLTVEFETLRRTLAKSFDRAAP